MRICMFAMVAGMCVVAFSFTGADVVVFTNDATIARDDYGYEGDDIIVSNGTLTIEGAHAFSTLSVYSNGFIEQYGEAELGAQGLFLDRGTFTLGGGCLLNVSNTVLLTNEARLIVQCTNLYISGDERWGGIGATIQASNLIVATGCVVTADAQGYPCVRPGWNGNGPGGGGGVTGGYIPGGGGYGGLGQIGHGAAAGQVYGTAHLPREPGSAGGGNYIPGGSANSGLSGGGAMRLNVWNTMSLDGVVSANGQGETYIYCGGGSGGSILANVNRLVGAGAFFAEGGNQEAHSGTDGGGGRVAVYFLDASNFTGFASSSVAGGPRAEAGTLFTSQTAVCFWDHALPLAHDEQTLAWAGMGMRADEVYVDITASNTGGVFTIASNRFVAGSLTWLTTHLPDAQYLLKATVYSLADAEIVSASTNVLVNNSVAWHSGVIDSNETWSSQRVHVVEGNVFVNTGVVVTVEAGAVVKFAPNTAMIIKTNASVVAHGSSGREITFTSLADDAVGGDTNCDGGNTSPQPGDWIGIEARDNGLFDANAYVQVRYCRNTHAGVLSENETWMGSFLHLVTNTVTVPSGITLTIEPGAVVKFLNYDNMLIQNGGRLLVDAHPATPVYFTSFKDDSVGGDANNDGDATTPAAGDWRWIQLDNGRADLNHAIFKYGGGTYNGSWDGTAVLRASGGNARLNASNCIIRDAFFDGIEVWDGAGLVVNCVLDGIDRAVCAQPNGQLTVRNCTIHNNRIGILVHGGTMDVANSLITDSLENGVQYDMGALASFRYNNVYNSGSSNYVGLADLTSTDGNVSADPLYRDAAAYDYRLSAHSPAIDAADTPLAPTNDFIGAPRVTDPTAPHPGIPGPGGEYADMGAYEYTETAPSGIDLIVTQVAGPTSVLAGALVEVHWTVQNIGEDPAVGPWHDAVYLIQDLGGTTGSIMKAGNVLVALGTNLANNQSLDMTGQVRVPGGVDGAYRWMVEANALYGITEGSNHNNNTRSADEITTLASAEVKVDGAAVVGQFTQSGQSLWFKLTPGANRDIHIALDRQAATGVTEMYVARGYVPTRQNYDYKQDGWNQPDADLTLPDTAVGDYYILVYVNSLPGGATGYSLSASEVVFSLTSVSPASMGNNGASTLTLIGGGLNEEMICELISPAGTTTTAASVTWMNSSCIHATFNLTAASVGMYDVQIRHAENHRLLENAVQVSVVEVAGIEFSIVAPAIVRPGRQTSIMVEYVNSGNVDQQAPLFFLETKRAAVSEDHKADATTYTNLVYLAITENEGPAGVIPPGAKGRLSLALHPDLSLDDVEIGIFDFNDDGILDWASMKDEMKPQYMSSQAWEVVFANFRQEVGTTVAQYNQVLAENATYLGNLGIYTHDEAQLMAFELQQADAFGEISLRNDLGPMGYGNPISYMAQLLTDTNGHVSIGSVLGVRYFTLQGDGSYQSGIGDHGVLKKQGGVYTLYEKDGSRAVFNSNGQYNYIENADGYRVTFQYTGVRLDGLTDSYGQDIAYAYNAQGRIQYITDEVGRVTTLSYDPGGEHLSAVSGTWGRIAFTYITGQGAACEHAVSSITYPDNTHTYMEYDTKGRLATTYRDGGAERITFTYDSAGGLTISNAAGGVSRAYINNSGRLGASLSQVTDALQRRWQVKYDDAFNVSQISVAGQIMDFDYDERGNLSRMVDPLGRVTSLSYSTNLNQLTRYANPKYQTYTYSYDAKGNPTGIHYPDGSSRGMTFNTQNLLTQWSNRRGQTALSTYNGARLLTSWSASDGLRSSYSYDGHRNLVTASNHSGRVVYQYDGADRLTNMIAPDGKWLRLSYDTGGRRSQLRTSEGFEVNYSYDSVGRLYELRDAAAGLIVRYDYDVAGRLIEAYRGNGVRTVYAYDIANRIAGLIHYKPDDLFLSYYNYQYNDEGWPSVISSQQGLWSNRYDAAGQLTSAEFHTFDTNIPDQSLTYTYDNDGNRMLTVINGATTRYAANTMDQYTSVGPENLSYDQDGNLVSRDDGTNAWVYSYDSLNRLTNAVTPQGVWRYEYDALGRRVAKVEDGARTDYLLDPTGMGHVISEYSFGHTAQYAHGLGLASCTMPSNNLTCYYHYDARGSARQLTGTTGALLNTSFYLPFGEQIVPQQTLTNAFGFVGQLGVMQESQDFLYMRARYYLPELGRFITEEPMGLLFPNAYHYANNSPFAFVDPSGLNPENRGPFRKFVTWVVGVDPGDLIESTSQNHFGPNGSYYKPAIAGKKYSHNQLLVSEIRSEAIGQSIRDRYATWKTGWDAAYFGFCNVNPFGGTPGIESFVGGTIAGALVDSIAGFFEGGDAKPSSFNQIFINQNTRSNINALDKESVKSSLEELRRLVEDTEEFRERIKKGSGIDPNDIIGPAGAGPENWVRIDQLMLYTILFENLTNATLPAQTVSVTNQLDADLDLSTFELGDYGFGTNYFTIPAGLQSYTNRIDMRDALDLYVDFKASLDAQTRTVTWYFESIDPETGQLTQDPLKGFLPPNTNPPTGEGFVSYMVRSKTNLAEGAVIDAQALIIFDLNDPIVTPAISNTIDATPPVSSMQALPAQSRPVFPVSWGGYDAGSGIATFDIYVSRDDAPYVRWMTSAETSAAYTGTVGSLYRFISLARDAAGYTEPGKTVAEAWTRVARAAINDYDGDAVSDVAVYWTDNGLWEIVRSSDGQTQQVQWGWGNALPTPSDYDGDGRADIAVFWPNDTEPNWYIRESHNDELRIVDWGWSGCLPVPADYDGDGLADIAVFWPNVGNWYIHTSGSNAYWQINWGWDAALAVPSDYDGDAKANIAVYWPADAGANWFIRKGEHDPIRMVDLGWHAAVPVPMDYDGDGTNDPAVYWPETGNWYIFESSGGYRQQNFGWEAAAPVPADYDGDGEADIGIYWAAGGVWYILQSSDGQIREVHLGGEAAIPAWRY